MARRWHDWPLLTDDPTRPWYDRELRRRARPTYLLFALVLVTFGLIMLGLAGLNSCVYPTKPTTPAPPTCLVWTGDEWEETLCPHYIPLPLINRDGAGFGADHADD